MRVSHSVVMREKPPSKRCYGVGSEQQRFTNTHADLHLCCSHMAKKKKRFLMTWLKYEHCISYSL